MNRKRLKFDLKQDSGGGEWGNFEPAALLRKLNALGCEHAVGRIDIVENRYPGMKDRGVYETPGGTILHHAHRALESITMDREVMHLRDSLMPKYAELVYNGYWFAPEREMLQAAISQSQQTATGEVRLKLFKGGVHVWKAFAILCTVLKW